MGSEMCIRDRYWHFVDIVWIIIFGLLYLITAGDGVPPGGVPWTGGH